MELLVDEASDVPELLDFVPVVVVLSVPVPVDFDVPEEVAVSSAVLRLVASALSVEDAADVAVVVCVAVAADAV